MTIRNQDALKNAQLGLLALLLFLGNRSENIPVPQSTAQDWLGACIPSKEWGFFQSKKGRYSNVFLARHIPNTLLKCDQGSDSLLSKDLHVLFKQEGILDG